MALGSRQMMVGTDDMKDRADLRTLVNMQMSEQLTRSRLLDPVIFTIISLLTQRKARK